MSEASDRHRPPAGDAGQQQRGGNRPRHVPKFSGKCSALKGHVYDVASSDPTESFHKTTLEIAEFVAVNFDGAGEYRRGLVDMLLPPVNKPDDPADGSNAFTIEKWKIEYQEYERQRIARKNQDKVFALILGQCTPAMVDRLHAESTWTTIDNTTDVIGLLKLIQTNATVKQSQYERSHALFDAYTDFFSFRQLQLSLSDYYQGFKDRLDHLERINGPIGQDRARIDEYLAINHPTGASDQENRAAEHACREAFLATILLFQADRRRFGGLHLLVKNNYTLDKRGYPKTLTDAFNALTKWETDHRHGTQYGNTFLSADTPDNGNRRGRGRKGRNNNGGSSGAAEVNQGSSNSDTSEQSDVYSLLRLDLTLHQDTSRVVPKSWIILDTASTVDMFLPNMLTHIHETDEVLEVVSTGGTTKIQEKGTLPGYPDEVWCNRRGVANIISLHNLQKHYRIEYDNNVQDKFLVHVEDTRVLEFLPSGNGLYHFKGDKMATNHFTLLSTVKENEANVSKRGIQQAKLARRVQKIIMRPGTRRYKDIIAKNYLRNCPIQTRHVQMAEDLYGPEIGSIKGKTPRHTPPHVTARVDAVPPEILERHGRVSLAVDIMFVNKVPFLLTLARGLQIATVEELDNRQVTTVQRKISNTISKYEHRGFKIDTIMADEEFAPLTELMPTENFNICGADDHVPEIERFVRTIKDSVRAQYNDLPFSNVPRILLTHMVRNAVFWWNAFPHEESDAGLYSTWYLLEGKTVDYTKHVRIPFGSYAQTHEQHDNSMDARTVGAICLGPTGNQQGSHYFMSLSSGRVLTRTKFTELPMPQDVVTRVSDMGRLQGMPRAAAFGDRYGHELEDRDGEIDDDHDSDYEYDSDDDEADHQDDIHNHYHVPSDDEDGEEIEESETNE